MEFTCNTKRLLAAVTACCRVSRRQNFKPVLECIRITGGEGSIAVFATDLEKTLSLDVPCEVSKSGSFIINGQRLRAALAQESSETVTLTQGETQILLKADRSELSFGVQEDALPTVSSPSGEPVASLHCITIAAAIRSTSWSTDENAERYVLGGIYFDCNENEINFVATNGRTLAAYGPLAPGARECSAIIPESACTTLVSVLPEHGSCSIVASSSDMAFLFDGGYFVARQLEGRFPKWRMVFPATRRIEIDVPTGSLSEIVSKCLLVRREGDAKASIARAVETEFNFGNGKIIAKAKSDIGTAEAECLIGQCETETVFFDSNYAASVVRAMTQTDVIRIVINDPYQAVLFEQGYIRCIIQALDPRKKD